MPNWSNTGTWLKLAPHTLSPDPQPPQPSIPHLTWGFRQVGQVGFRVYLEGQGDLVSRLIMGIIRVTIWVIGVINLLYLLSPPDPPC